MDMLASDESPSQVSDKIKELLYTKASTAVQELRPSVAASMFGLETEVEAEED